jgi:hypothetical protein
VSRTGTPEKASAPRASGSRPAPRDAPATGAAGDRPAVVADGLKVAAWLSIAAGAIHAIAMVDHFSHWWLYGAFFLGLTYGQVLWGVAALRAAPSIRSLATAAYLNLAIVGVWLVSRTLGVPVGPDAGTTEPVGIMDVAATLDQLVLAAYVAVIIRPDLRARRGLRTLLGVHRVRFGMMLCSASVFAALLGGHSH